MHTHTQTHAHARVPSERACVALQNGEVLSTSWEEDTVAKRSSRLLRLDVRPQDNQALLGCEATNLVSKAPLSILRRITVHCEWHRHAHTGPWVYCHMWVGPIFIIIIIKRTTLITITEDTDVKYDFLHIKWRGQPDVAVFTATYDEPMPLCLHTNTRAHALTICGHVLIYSNTYCTRSGGR